MSNKQTSQQDGSPTVRGTAKTMQGQTHYATTTHGNDAIKIVVLKFPPDFPLPSFRTTENSSVVAPSSNLLSSKILFK